MSRPTAGTTSRSGPTTLPSPPPSAAWPSGSGSPAPSPVRSGRGRHGAPCAGSTESPVAVGAGNLSNTLGDCFRSRVRGLSLGGSTVKRNELSWTIGGPQGSGVDSSANAFGRAVTFGGLHVYGRREYYSNIKGEHSYFQIRVAGHPIGAHVDPINVLATFDEETAFRHFPHVTDDGAILYDPAQVNTKYTDIPTIEKRVKRDLGRYLEARGGGETLGDALRTAEARGVRLCPVPFQDYLNAIAKEFQVDQLSSIARMVNLMAVGGSFGLLGFEFERVEQAIQSLFAKRPKVATMNLAGARRAYDLVHDQFGEGFAYRLEPIPSAPRLLLTGAQAVALGKILGGCRFQTYYPITPASDESEYLEAHQNFDAHAPTGEGEETAFLQEHAQSLLVIQTEDEIAAVTMATGAAIAGVRAATCTSGPG